jgi:hypothetical protein
MWLIAMGEIVDWGHFRPWWSIARVAKVSSFEARVGTSYVPQLSVDDHILEIDGKPFDHLAWLRLFRYGQPGQTVRLKVEQQKRIFDIDIQLKHSSSAWAGILLSSVAMPLLWLAACAWILFRLAPTPAALAALAYCAGGAWGKIWVQAGLFGGLPDTLFLVVRVCSDLLWLATMAAIGYLAFSWTWFVRRVPAMPLWTGGAFFIITSIWLITVRIAPGFIPTPTTVGWMMIIMPAGIAATIGLISSYRDGKRLRADR